MAKIIKENFNKILSIFILIQPILDLLTGICIHTFNLNITIGIFVRILFMLFIVFTTVFIYKKKLPLLISTIIFIYAICYLLGIVIYKDGVLFNEIQNLVKVFYFSIVLTSLYSIKDEIRISKMTLFITLSTYLLFILIPNLLGIGFKSYEITKSGTLGFFNSANEISGIISILTPIVFVIIKDMKTKIIKVVFAITYLFVILTIGTKTPLLSILITLGLTLLYYIINCINKKTYKPIIYSIVAVMICSMGLLIVLPKTNFYKNIQVHLEFLEVDNIVEVFKDKELIDHFIFSQRLTFLENKQKLYSESSIYQKIFGIGYTNQNEITKSIEIDYFDILYSHGIVGFIVFFGIYIYIFINILKNRIREKNYQTFMFKISIFLIIILSFFTGHIITAPAVSIFVAVLLLNLNKSEQKRIIFITDNKKTKDYNNNIKFIKNSKTNLLIAILLEHNNYDYAIYDKETDEKLARLYSEISYKYSRKNQIIKKILN